MARLGPFEPRPGLALGVSGGADSTAMALLAAEWAAARGGYVRAFIVDHGLRAGSDAEALRVRARLAGLGIWAEVLALKGLRPAAAAARMGRLAALEAATVRAGLLHLVLGHHADDQAETVRMRAQAGSGAAGLAGMAAVRETAGMRVLRPLLGVRGAALRAWLEARGVGWEEDPTNLDRAYRRPVVRAALRVSGETAGLCEAAARHGAVRAAAEAAVAAGLAQDVAFSALGYAVLPLRLVAGELAAAWGAVSGRPFPPPAAAMAKLAAAPRAATLWGVRMLPAGRLGPGWLLVAEQAPRAVAARDGEVWGRFVLRAPELGEGLVMAGGGGDAGLPAVVRAVVPQLWRGDERVALPVDAAFRLMVAVPAAGAGFVPACNPAPD